MKAILSAVGLMLVLPFYCLYLIARGISRLFGPARPARQSPPEKTFSPDEAEMYDAIFEDD